MFVKVLKCFPGTLGFLPLSRWSTVHMTQLKQHHTLSRTCLVSASNFSQKISVSQCFSKEYKLQWPVIKFCRNASQKQGSSHQSGQVVESKQQGQVTVGQKVAQAGKDATYTFIVIAGIAVTGVMFYAIGRELFSGQSPAGVYSKAYKLCRKNEDVAFELGEPLKGYGEMNRRGRRRHVRHTEFEVDGVKHMRLQFYLEGPYKKGTAHVEVKQNERGKYEFRYLFVDVDSIPRRTIIVEDNR